MPEMIPLNQPAALAYEAWAERQSYRPISWERLTPEQRDAWRRVVATVLNWYDDWESSGVTYS
jgi:hypothetical protein